MYKKVSTDLNFQDREKEILAFWNDHDIFKKSIALRKDGPTYTFYDGPPTANGKPHIGHVLTRVIKDLIPRYRTMKGYKVLRKAGWDTHGLPVELEVEKALGLDGKEQIEEYGLEPFIEKCKESVWKYKGMWEDFSGTVGFWADMDDPYVTYHNEYIESIWWILKQIWEKDLLYKGHKIVPYCPRCGTPLSSHEVAQGYKDVKEKSVVAKFKVKDEENVYILAWTTTPWTLPSNVALSVNPVETYIKAKVNDEYFILAEALAEKVLGETYEVIQTYTGKDLEYTAYEPLFDFAKPDQKAHYVACADFVTLSDGTGVVHTAPAFGEDDAQVGRKYGLPFVQLVNEQGEFVEAVTPWKGIFVKKADPMIIDYLEEKGLLFHALDYEHSYPYCWRCDTALLYYARDTWFIKMTEIRDQLIKNNDQINWLPEAIGTKRFGNWLENVMDWGLSRDRYWGTPLNIWECDCGHRHAIGSIEELKSMSDNCPDDIELHRPYIDDVLINCPECNGKMKRASPVIDCWFDSGAMPYAQWHYPFENKEIFEDNFPADFISEAVDQTRGWFYSLLAISTLLFDKPAFKNVIVLGLVQDENGQKMSKSKGNAVDPFEALSRHGADAVRWYFYNNSAPWLPNKFYDNAVIEGQRKFMGTFWNTYAFYVLYANIDGFNPSQYTLEYDKLPLMDKWLLSKLNTLIKTVDTNLGNYLITESSRAIQEFVDDLSNWYVRRSRERFWQKDMPQDKVNAYMTLYTALSTLAKVSAPFVPFMADEIYLNLESPFYDHAPESVHLCDFPEVNEDLIDLDLEKNMDLVLRIVVNGRACRNSANIKNRQPIGKMYVKSSEGLSEMYKAIISEELNIKEVLFTEDVRAFTTYSFKPQLKTVGPKYGKLIPQIKKGLMDSDGNGLMDELKANGLVKLTIGDTLVSLAEEDLLIESAQKPGYESLTDRHVTVVLDTNLSDALIEEGYVREVISKIQTMRKEADFEVTDHIRIYAGDNDKLMKIIEENKQVILSETLADSFVEKVSQEAYEKTWNINGEKLNLAVERV
ncbi:isoleucine--tRNA ligase [Vallitalea pronyensis]|uniref:Isoleucine--tRNA ligase n=1 Tax=Vallitalea pronyensis TaxID=1348613 RepID=A0A8J8MGZ4_9FIRM|nr:isoleucine--tRNA ligase [Vallitalea pronyensis]QUI21424.1 isoleucine--tRNA ligase [Vallitalea pronyensis]